MGRYVCFSLLTFVFLSFSLASPGLSLSFLSLPCYILSFLLRPRGVSWALKPYFGGITAGS